MSTYGAEQYQREVDACLAERVHHFCSCRDLECPLNPNNPRNLERGRGCDAWTHKRIAIREIPSCFFNEVGAWPEGLDEFTYAGFVHHCNGYGIE